MKELEPEVARSTVLPVPRARVWAALTDAAQLSRWFGGQVLLDPRPGGHGLFPGAGGPPRQARVEEIDHERRLTLRWWAPGSQPSLVTFELEDVAEGTRLTVVERAAWEKLAWDPPHAPEDPGAVELRTGLELRMSA